MTNAPRSPIEIIEIHRDEEVRQALETVARLRGHIDHIEICLRGGIFPADWPAMVALRSLEYRASRHSVLGELALVLRRGEVAPAGSGAAAEAPKTNVAAVMAVYRDACAHSDVRRAEALRLIGAALGLPADADPLEVASHATEAVRERDRWAARIHVLDGRHRMVMDILTGKAGR